MPASYNPSFVTTSTGKSSSPNLKVWGSSIFISSRNSSADKFLDKAHYFFLGYFIMVIESWFVLEQFSGIGADFRFFKKVLNFFGFEVDVESDWSCAARFRFNWSALCIVWFLC